MGTFLFDELTPPASLSLYLRELIIYVLENKDYRYFVGFWPNGSV